MRTMTEYVTADDLGVNARTGAIKLHGLDAPQKIDINIHASMDVLKQHVRALSDDELVRLTGAGGIIVAEARSG